MDQLALEYPLDITYKSYYLRPDIPPEGVVRPLKEGEVVGGLLTGHVGQTADGAGLTMRRASVTPNTRMAFEASEYAKDMGVFEIFHRECYIAFWEEGADLGQMVVLQGIGEKVGLDPNQLKEILESGVYTTRTREQYDEAISLGVNGIPSFIMGGYFFSGAQPYEIFKRVAEMVRNPS